MKWEIIKYKIRCFCIKFSKNIAKEKRRKFEALERNINQFENCPSSDSISMEIYSANKLEFEALMEEKQKVIFNGLKLNGMKMAKNQVNYF